MATGLSLGIIGYKLVKDGAGKYREISVLIWVLTILFVIRYADLALE